MGMINGVIKQLQDMLLLYGNKTILTISDGENEYDIKSITGKPCAKYFEPKDKVAEVTITVKPTVKAIPKDQYENCLKAEKVAMLTELKKEIEQQLPMIDICDYAIDSCVSRHEVASIIQEKINELKGENNGIHEN